MVGLLPSPSCSFTHKRHGTTHSHCHDTFVPHISTFNTAASGHLADLQSWLNLADFPIDNMLPLYCAPGGSPTRLWNGENASSYSQLEVDHHPVSAQSNGHYTYPTQAQCVRSDHWDHPNDSHLNREPMRPPHHLDTIPVSILISSYQFLSTLVIRGLEYCQTPPHVEAEVPVVFWNSTASLGEMSQGPYGSLNTSSTGSNHEVRQLASSWAAYPQPHYPRDTPPSKARCYNRPGREPAVKFEPDAAKLQEACERYRGSSFAVDWIVVVFRHGVTTEALFRPLDSNEIDQMNFPGGFRPRQAYDGFISKIGGLYECGLCKEGKKTHWKHKKDAPRHLRKFHFGLGDLCTIWCVR